jgi:hypothetical protein
MCEPRRSARCRNWLFARATVLPWATCCAGLDSRTREATLAQAAAQLEQAAADFEAASTPVPEGLCGQDPGACALRAQRDAAQATVEAAEWDLRQITITRAHRRHHRRPAGTQGLAAEWWRSVRAHCRSRSHAGRGTGVRAGSGRPEAGHAGHGETGDRRCFRRRYFVHRASIADAATRTFRVDITLAQPRRGVLRDGVTSEITVPLDDRRWRICCRQARWC